MLKNVWHVEWRGDGRLTYRRANHDNIHVRGYKEVGTWIGRG
jgi:phosphoketolase